MNRIHMTISKLHKVVFSLIRQRDDYEVVSVADNFFFLLKSLHFLWKAWINYVYVWTYCQLGHMPSTLYYREFFVPIDML